LCFPARNLRIGIDSRWNGLRLARDVRYERYRRAELAQRPGKTQYNADDDSGQRQWQRDEQKRPTVAGTERAVAVPDLPTVAETVPGFSVNNWIGLFAPAGTPPEIVNKLNTEVLKVMESPDVQKRMESEGARYTRKTPDEFGQFVRAETVKWAKVLKDAGIKPE